MASWEPDHSMILSLLLDTVVGTTEMIAIRQDYCRLNDCLDAASRQDSVYFTGSKAEGLDLPGSNLDYMLDHNNSHKIKITQLLHEEDESTAYSTFFMSTEYVPPGFALLQHLHQTPIHPLLACQKLNDIRYLSSDFIVQDTVSKWSRIPYIQSVQRQGPSAEIWVSGADPSESGIDTVVSIHCAFWPTEALEWAQRPRHFGWPTSRDISSIIGFGFHLVPVGHPHSPTKLIEWRISFSMAERKLVWSFNHAQMQCYAVMKIILKEFIKVRCSSHNQVLCSYFIKTFLFWIYETTQLNFWREDNLGECIKYLLVEFSKCIREGVLRHYFIPTFKLLSVKLTPAAKTELLSLFAIIIQSDVSILKECRTLQKVWSEFLQCRENRNNIKNRERENLLRNDECMFAGLQYLRLKSCYTNRAISQVLARSCKTPLRTLALKQSIFHMHLSSLMHTRGSGNKGVYHLCKVTQRDTCPFDISTCKLWCAILLFKTGDILSSLNIIIQMLSSIPPFVMYYEGFIDPDAEQLYVGMFLDSDVTVIQRARTAWMLELIFTPNLTDVVPLAIQIELYFLCPGMVLQVSPFTCAYYLQFLCYHRMQMYDNRDRALQQLIEVVNNIAQNGIPWTPLNIAGHCLFLVGRKVQAREMFYRSYIYTQSDGYEKWNSAMWYLLNCF